MRKPIRNHTVPGEAVYKPFCGSGATLIAAGQTGRICYAVELDPRYVDGYPSETGRTGGMQIPRRGFQTLVPQQRLK